jgi:hypothetical protein
VLPNTNITAVSALVFLGVKFENPKIELPSIGLALSYSDIGGEKHEVRYNCKSVEIVRDEGENFRGFMEFTKQD